MAGYPRRPNNDKSALGMSLIGYHRFSETVLFGQHFSAVGKGGKFFVESLGHFAKLVCYLVRTPPSGRQNA
jgi:hypothetical protein